MSGLALSGTEKNVLGPSFRVGYVLKRYPRYSETFVVNEILAHEEADLGIAVYALRPPADTHFQSGIARVRAPVNYLSTVSKVSETWDLVHACAREFPNVWSALSGASDEHYRNAHQAVELALRAKKDHIAHFHAHFATDAAAVVRLASQITGIPYSLTAHAKDIFHETVDDNVLLSRMESAKRVITVSEYNVRFLEEKFGRRLANLSRVYNGLDLDDFEYTEPDDREPLILGVGRLVEKKGFSYLIEACAILKQWGVAFECSILGTGELMQELSDQIVQLDLDDLVTLEGPRPSTEVVEALNRAAVLAAPCVVGSDGNRDGLPTVLLEAMAVGTPCVSTDVTGIPEVIVDGQTGLQVPQHDAEALALALRSLIDNPDLRCRVARAARQLIEDEFDIRRNAATIRDLIAPAEEGRPRSSELEIVGASL